MSITEQEVRLGGAIVPLLAAAIKNGDTELTEDEIHRAFEMVHDSEGNYKDAHQTLSLTLQERGYFRLEPNGYEQSIYLLSVIHPDVGEKA